MRAVTTLLALGARLGCNRSRNRCVSRLARPHRLGAMAPRSPQGRLSWSSRADPPPISTVGSGTAHGRRHSKAVYQRRGSGTSSDLADTRQIGDFRRASRSSAPLASRLVSCRRLVSRDAYTAIYEKTSVKRPNVCRSLKRQRQTKVANTLELSSIMYQLSTNPRRGDFRIERDEQ